MPTVKFSDNPNEETAFVTQDGGQRNRAVLTAALNGTIKYPDNPNSTKVTVTVDGVDRKAVAVADIAGGGGDSHNKGYYATQSALETAYPTAEAGDYAIVGTTDTVWVWDSDTTAWKDTGQAGIELPDQTGQNGKFLTTNGTNASWGKALTNKTTALGAVVISPGNIGDIMVGQYGVCVGNDTNTVGECGVSVGYSAGRLNSNSKYAICIGYNNAATAIGAYQFGSGTNSEAGTVCFALNTDGNKTHWHNYKVLDSDGTVPSDRLVHAINKYSTMPTAASTNEGWIVQFTGTTDSTYTHGHLYECVSDGADPATYSWTEVQLGSGGSSYTAGTGISIDANDEISVAAPVAQLVQTPGMNNASVYGLWANTGITSAAGNIVLGYNASTNSPASSGCAAIGAYAVVGNGCIAVGGNAKAPGTDCIAVGGNAKAPGIDCIAVGNGAQTGQYASSTIQFGYGTNSTSNTLQVWSYRLLNKSDGTIPTERLTKVNSTITLTAAGWSGGSQTVTVTGMTATGVVLVSPDPTDQSAYTSAGILCTSQTTDSLTFTATTTPTSDIDVNIVCL